MVTITKPRRYFTARKAGESASVDFDTLKGLFWSAYQQFSAEGYWQEAFGYGCADAGEVEGTIPHPIGEYVQLHTKRRLWPIWERRTWYDEGALFDLIEFLFDHVSKPIEGWHHTFNDCGWHWNSFDRPAGQAEYRKVVSDLLEGYGSGYELNGRGEIMELAPAGMDKLLKASPPTTSLDVMARLNRARDRFQRYGSSLDNRRYAVRELADIFEKLRPQVKEVLNRKDEADLFNIANNFSIRHADEKQKSDYDPAVWLSWMFYFYLATINACLHLLKRKQTE